MFELPLHAGSGHPNLFWILVPSFLTFLAGLGLGARSERILKVLRPDDASSSE
ncbi:hypothetical protein C482_02236 [Natrialba chahannaoensis JCM 10990]|uniref:Uncharacterized protein n=1 Tax=Natrialba chahannaoensis JCM 10990 TaxID=1227492 RepID=M0B338_9EURY|nr:hypothetical protein [Natrialba chahannaoensis]ELZ05331.1 hypothetical protein C482_02236 [Natrialba chahannaoensis JCM 10990]